MQPKPLFVWKLRICPKGLLWGRTALVLNRREMSDFRQRILGKDAGLCKWDEAVVK